MKTKKENLNHLHKKPKKTYTLMFIPHWEKELKKITLSQTSIITGLGFVMILLIILATTSIYFTRLSEHNRDVAKEHEHAYLSLMEEYQELEDAFALQETEIDYLYNYTDTVKEEVENLTQLQHEVLDLVGLDETALAEVTIQKPITRSLGGSILNTRGEANPVASFNPLYDLGTLIDNQSQRFEEMIPKIEDQLEYLDAKPNILPAEGRISSAFGYRKHPFTRKIQHHDGIDITNNYSTPIHASGSGVVIVSGYQPGYGRIIIIDHGFGYQSTYAHNQSNLVDVGDRVDKKQQIAYMGSTGVSTGPHVHFEIRHEGEIVDPLEIINN